MKLAYLCSLYSKFNSNILLHNKITFVPQITTSNKCLASDRRFYIKTENPKKLKQLKNGKKISQQNIDGRSKNNSLVHRKYSNDYFHTIRINSHNSFSQFGNDYISKQFRKGLLMMPGIAISNPFNHILQEDNMFLIHKILGIHSQYRLLEKFENFCDLLCGFHQPLMQGQLQNSICFLGRDMSDYKCLSYNGRRDNLSHIQESFLSQKSYTGQKYIHNNYPLRTSPKMTHNLSKSRQNYSSCRDCRKPQEKPLPSETNALEKENHSGLLTCNKGRQSGEVSCGSDGNDEGLLTCRRVGQIIEQEKQAEEKIEEAERRKELQGTWKDLCRRCTPTKDSVTLARTSFWWKIINRLRGNNMDERLQKYLGNIPPPFIRKSLAERRKELGEDVSKPVAKWACKAKKKVKRTKEFARKDEKLNQQTGELAVEDKKLNQQTGELTVKDKKLNQQTGELTVKDKKLNQQTEKFTLEDKKLNQQTGELTLQYNKLNQQTGELKLEDKRLNQQIEELGVVDKKLKQDKVG